MTAQTYQMISIVGLILAAVFCVTALVIWFRLGIWQIIGDLSGRTAKKSIEKMRRENEASGKMSFRPASAAVKRWIYTNDDDTGIRLRKGSGAADGEDVTELIGEASGDDIYAESADHLGNAGSDAVFETVSPANVQTEAAGVQTSWMDHETEMMDESLSVRVSFHVIQDIVLIHTNEVIQ